MAWERLRRIREKAEAYVDREARQPVREVNEARHRSAGDAAAREYKETLSRAHRDVHSGEISEELRSKRIKRARERFERTREPVGNRVAKKLVGAADRVYNPSGRGLEDSQGRPPRYAQRHRATFDAGQRMLTGSSRSYTRASKSTFKHSRSTHQYGNYLLTGSAGGTPKASGWGILYGPSGNRGGRGGGRKGRKSKRGDSNADPFWML